MKLNKTTIIAIIAASGLLALSPALRAQDATKGAAPADTKPAPKKGGKRGGPTIEMYTDQLKLTTEQIPKVQKAMDERTKAMADVAPEDRATKMPAIRDAFNAKMKEILTPDQLKTFEAMPQRGGGGKGKKANATPAPAPAPPKADAPK